MVSSYPQARHILFTIDKVSVLFLQTGLFEVTPGGMDMRLASLIAVATLTASAGIASAEQPGAVVNTDGAVRHVFMCDRSAETSPTWLRDCADHSATVRPTAAKVARQVFMCDRTSATRRAWMRQFGEMTFVTAEEFAKAEASNETWSTPRCMTEGQMRQVVKAMPATPLAYALASATSM
jgi:hypothetical protein